VVLLGLTIAILTRAPLAPVDPSVEFVRRLVAAMSLPRRRTPPDA